MVMLWSGDVVAADQKAYKLKSRKKGGLVHPIKEKYWLRKLFVSECYFSDLRRKPSSFVKISWKQRQRSSKIHASRIRCPT